MAHMQLLLSRVEVAMCQMPEQGHAKEALGNVERGRNQVPNKRRR